jgi:hypothetical protein
MGVKPTTSMTSTTASVRSVLAIGILAGLLSSVRTT